jgi:serine/threonine-protein kinase
MTRSHATSHAASGAARQGPAARLPRRQVGQWELIAQAGEGSLTEVYRARPTGAEGVRAPAYAVKLLRAKWEDDSRAIDLLRREARVGRAVSHPHLIPVLAAGVREPPYFVVMPWLTGRTLDELHLGEGPLDLPVVLWLARQVAEALEALEAAGWMHGDVKPTNIFVSEAGHVTLLDLGFARRPDETGSAADRCVVGTCNYIAPELITSALAADVRSDIYSLGVVLFELLSGRLPFQSSNLAELAAQHKQARPPDLRSLSPQLPIGVINLVHQMLAKQPLRRPQTPGELIERLAELEIQTFGERAAWTQPIPSSCGRDS